MKHNGRCTGESRLPWQAEPGEYVTICPAAIVHGMARAYNLWASVHDFHAMPVAGGSMEQPARWWRIIRLLESEYNRPAEREDVLE